MSETQGSLATKKSKSTTKTSEPKQPRVFKSTTTLHHDLFVLHPSQMMKDKRLDKTGYPDEEDLIGVAHQHFFHTIDSQGRKQLYCSPIGGHFHEIIIKEKGEGEPPEIVEVSGPMKWGMKKKGGKYKRVAVPVNEYDKHTHEIKYLQSEKVTPRKANVEAAKVATTLQMKESPSGHGLGGQVSDN